MSIKQLQEKWAPVLNHDALPEIADSHKRGVVAQLLENQEKAQIEESAILSETLQTTGYTQAATDTGPVAGFDPVLISLIRRSMPQLIAYDIAGVQPMTGPTGLIFAMRTNYGSERNPAASGRTTKHSSTSLTLVSLVVAAPPTILALLALLTTMQKAPTLHCLTIPPLEPMSRLQMQLA